MVSDRKNLTGGLLGGKKLTTILRFAMNGVLLGGLALILPACGSSNSSTSGGSGAAPNPNPAPIFADPGIETFPMEGRTHVPVGTVVVYLTDPPTSGNHYPSPEGGVYSEIPIEPGFLVHSLEHGGIVIYYNPATVTDAQKNSLKALAQAHPGIYSQVVCVPRNDPVYPIILTAWTHWLRLTTYDQSRIDGFVTLFLDQGPEHAPTSPWNTPTVSNATALSFFESAADLSISDIARPGSASTTTAMTFIAQSMTFSVDLQISAASALTDTESIEILDSTSAAVLAQAVYDASTGMMTFSIGTTSFPSIAVSIGPFHTVTFEVDASQNATWSVEGTITSPGMAFGTPTVRVGISAAFASGVATAPVLFFGNLVTGQ